MNKKLLPHIIAVGAFVVFIVLGLACATMTPEQIAEQEAQKKARQEAEQEALRQYFLSFDEYAVGAVGADAVYWKNREVVKLPRVGVGAAGEIATSIVVSGNDVYIAGEILYSGSTFEAVYWKNNQPVILPRGSARVSEATSILVSGKDVYVTGRADNDAVYWKNGQLFILPRMNATSAVANAIAMSGNDAYIAGCLDNQAVYWRGNGQPVTLRSGSGAVAEAIAISGNNVYVAGSTSNNAVLWTNGQAAILPGEGIYKGLYKAGEDYSLPGGGYAKATSIFVSGADVYVGGYANTKYPGNDVRIDASYWKNGGVRTIMRGTQDAAYATSIFVINDSVYLGGYVENKIVYSYLGARKEYGTRKIAALFINNDKPILIGPNNPITFDYNGAFDEKQVINSVIRGIYVVKK